MAAGNPTTGRVSWPAHRLEDERLLEFGEHISTTRLDTTRMNYMATAHPPFVLGAPATAGRGD